MEDPNLIEPLIMHVRYVLEKYVGFLMFIVCIKGYAPSQSLSPTMTRSNSLMKIFLYLLFGWGHETFVE